MSAPIRAVLFDLGNTLAAYYHVEDSRAVLERAIRNTLVELHRRGRDSPGFDAVLAEALLLSEEAKDLRVRPLGDRLVRMFGAGLGADRELLDALSVHFLEPVFSLGRRYEDALPVLGHLRRAGIRTGIVSNSPWGSPPALWRAELQRLALLDAVDVTLFCGDVGWRKPAKIVFDRAAELIGVPAEYCCFVGDDPNWDLAGAAGAGMRALLLDREGRHAEHSHISVGNLWEVVRRLEPDPVHSSGDSR